VPTEKRARQRAARYQKQAKLERQRRRRKLMRRGLSFLVLAALIVLVVFLVSGTSPKKLHAATKPTGSTTTTATTLPIAKPQDGGTIVKWVCPNLNGSSSHILHFPNTQPPMCIDPAKTYTATFYTSEGDVKVVLDTTHTPLTADNFVVLALYHYYDGTSIDRIDPSIDILQGGSPTTQTIDDPGPGYTIKDEGSGYKYVPGDLVMARSSSPNSGAAQYFFVYGKKASVLDSQGTYVVFGHVVSGMSVLRKIAALYEPCPAGDSTCLGGLPRRIVLVKKVTIAVS
jgi:peptidyl-prolyl cis-trans isomerase B (cyclophilin B)